MKTATKNLLRLNEIGWIDSAKKKIAIASLRNWIDAYEKKNILKYENTYPDNVYNCR